MKKKPCPFCGGRPRVIQVGDGGVCVECHGCSASSKVVWDVGKGADCVGIAFAAWNLRTQLSQLEQHQNDDDEEDRDY